MITQCELPVDRRDGSDYFPVTNISVRERLMSPMSHPQGNAGVDVISDFRLKMVPAASTVALLFLRLHNARCAHYQQLNTVTFLHINFLFPTHV